MLSTLSDFREKAANAIRDAEATDRLNQKVLLLGIDQAGSNSPTIGTGRACFVLPLA